MKLSVDTNVLVRSVVRDDARQARAADKALTEAALIAVSLPCLCEFVWVLRKVYRFADAEIATAIRALAAVEKVAMNRSAVEAGLALLEAGGDFADAIMAHEGVRLVPCGCAAHRFHVRATRNGEPGKSSLALSR